MCIRTHPQVVWTDAHNWLQYFSMTSKVCKGYKIIPTHAGGDYFGFAAGLENRIQAAGGSLVADGWTEATQ